MLAIRPLQGTERSRRCEGASSCPNFSMPERVLKPIATPIATGGVIRGFLAHSASSIRRRETAPNARVLKDFIVVAPTGFATIGKSPDPGDREAPGGLIGPPGPCSAARRPGFRPALAVLAGPPYRPPSGAQSTPAPWD